MRHNVCGHCGAYYNFGEQHYCPGNPDSCQKCDELLTTGYRLGEVHQCHVQAYPHVTMPKVPVSQNVIAYPNQSVTTATTNGITVGGGRFCRGCGNMVAPGTTHGCHCPAQHLDYAGVMYRCTGSGEHIGSHWDDASGFTWPAGPAQTACPHIMKHPSTQVVYSCTLFPGHSGSHTWAHLTWDGGPVARPQFPSVYGAKKDDKAPVPTKARGKTSAAKELFG